jgi:hypothetical protein
LGCFNSTSSGAKKTAAYVSSPQEFKQLEKENNQLKKILGEKDLEIAQSYIFEGLSAELGRIFK